MTSRALVVGGGWLLAAACAAGIVAHAVSGSAAVTTEDRSRALPTDRDAPLRYVALGDSTVVGVGSRVSHGFVPLLARHLGSVYPRTEVTNLAVSGAKSLDVVLRQLPAAIRLQPDLVTLSIGPNDALARVPVETYAENIERIFDQLTRDTRAVVVVTLLPDLGSTPRFAGTPEAPAIRAVAVSYNAVLKRSASAHAVHIVDLFCPTRALLQKRRDVISGDGWHPSDIGYREWAELMWEHMRTLIPGEEHGQARHPQAVVGTEC